MTALHTEHLLRIGIVEDNEDLRDSLLEILAGNGHHCVGFGSAEDLDESSEAGAMDLMLVDINLPGEDGLSLTARLKHAMPRLRVIMMTTRGQVSDRVHGYDVGADIYMPKPLDVSELLAAVRALGRQMGSETGVAELKARLDVKALQLFGPATPTSLTAAEVAVLSALALAPGRRLEYWQLMELLGGEVDDAGKSKLAVRMTRLRGKLDAAGFPHDTLRSLRATGYQLCVPLELC